MVVAWLNDWDRCRRPQAYRQKLATGRALTKVVAEGNSWFQFPLFLDDIIDGLPTPSTTPIVNKQKRDKITRKISKPFAEFRTQI